MDTWTLLFWIGCAVAAQQGSTHYTALRSSWKSTATSTTSTRSQGRRGELLRRPATGNRAPGSACHPHQEERSLHGEERGSGQGDPEDRDAPAACP